MITNARRTAVLAGLALVTGLAPAGAAPPAGGSPALERFKAEGRTASVVKSHLGRQGASAR